MAKKSSNQTFPIDLFVKEAYHVVMLQIFYITITACPGIIVYLYEAHSQYLSRKTLFLQNCLKHRALVTYLPHSLIFSVKVQMKLDPAFKKLFVGYLIYKYNGINVTPN